MALEPGARFAGHYRLVRRIGRGAVGEVWQAVNDKVDRDVAIKFLVPEWPIDRAALYAFFQESKASGRVRHPSIVEILDLGEGDDETPFVVMELLEAEKLEIFLEREKTVPQGTALRLIAELAAALAQAHEKGLVHHRVEPGNVLLARDLRGVIVPKITDFGIARLIAEQAPESLRSWTAGSITPLEYLCPEQASGESAVDGRSDVWSLGVILHRLLVGANPFKAKTRAELLEAIAAPRKKPHEIDPKVDPRTSQLVADCLGSEAVLRPDARTLAERAVDLAEVFGDQWAALAKRVHIVAPAAADKAPEPPKREWWTQKPAAPAPIPPPPAKKPSQAPLPKSTATLRPAAVARTSPTGSKPALVKGGAPWPLDKKAEPKGDTSREAVARAAAAALAALDERDEEPAPLSSSDLLPDSTPTPPIALVHRPRSAPPPAKPPSAPPLKKTALELAEPHEVAPISQLIADRLANSDEANLDALVDLEAELMKRVAASRSSTPAVPPSPSETSEETTQPELPRVVIRRDLLAPPPAPLPSRKGRVATIVLALSAIFCLVSLAIARNRGPSAITAPSAESTTPVAATSPAPPSAPSTSTPTASATETISAPTVAAAVTESPSTTASASASIPSPPPVVSAPPVAIVPPVATTPPVATSIVATVVSPKPTVVPPKPTVKPKPTNDPTYGVDNAGF